MSTRTATTTATSKMQTPPAAPMTSTSVPHEKIAMRAYQKWMQRGCPCGTDKQDWAEAEAEIRSEMIKSGTNAGRR